MRKRIGTLCPRSPERVAVLAVFVLFVVAGAGLLSAGPKKEKTKPPVANEHQLYIQEAGARCLCADDKGNRRIVAQPGDWIVWNNQLGENVQISFPPSHRLFGVLEAVVYATGDPLRLQVRSDADRDVEIRYSLSCGTEMPGPSIIVPPPPPPGP